MPRKKYKPKQIRYDTLTYVVSGFKKVADVPDAGIKLLIRNHAAFDEIREGRGTKEHVDVLIHMVNMIEALGILGIGNDWLPEIRQAQDVIYNLAQRGLRLNLFIFYGPEIGIIQQIMELHDEQLRNCPVKMMEQALDLIAKEYKHKKMRVIEAKEVA
jgi:hypothetical protein